MARELRRFDVTFKDYSATYKAGDIVDGTVHLDCGQDVKCKGETDGKCLLFSYTRT